MGLVLPENDPWLALGAALNSQNKLALQEHHCGCHGAFVRVLGAEEGRSAAALGLAASWHSVFLSKA